MKGGFVFILLLIPIAGFADAWQIESVDTPGDVGWYTSIALDSSQNPHISYQDHTNGDLKYAWYDGSSWRIEDVDTTGDVGYYTSIALDSSQNPHISHYEYTTNRDLKYAWHDGSSWQIETVDKAGDVGYHTSITLDTSQNPHISYRDYTNGDLKYAWHDGLSWQIESVDTAGNVGDYTSIALDSSQNPHISYYNRTNHDLKYAWYDGSFWQIESVDTAGDMGTYNSIALDSSQNPHISYFDYTNLDLRYAWYDGSSWHIESVDTAGAVGMYTSIALDPSQNPHISYYDQADTNLKYAWYDGSSWQIESVDTVGNVGNWTSIALDSSQNPHISYRAATDSDLKYAWYNTPPSGFNLLSPADGSFVPDTPTLDWEDAEDAQPVTYDLWYSTEGGFDPHGEVNGLTDSTYTFEEGVLTDDTTYHWKVRAWDGYEEKWSGPDDYWSFMVDYEVGIAVTSFVAASASEGVKLSWECVDEAAGFNLHRSKRPGSGKNISSRDKLNAELITGESPYTYLDAAVEESVTYNYWLEAIDVGGSSETFGPVECAWRGAVPTTYALYQSRPNPATGNATIAFDLPEDTKVTLAIYDINGRKVTTVVDETLPVGNHERTVSGLAPGVYVYKLTASDYTAAKKMVIR